MSAPLSSYTTPDEIRARLRVLDAKANNIARYNETCRPGSAPDPDLLDEQQREILARYNRVGRKFPYRVHRTLGRTIWTLQERLAEVDQEIAA